MTDIAASDRFFVLFKENTYLKVLSPFAACSEVLGISLIF